MMKLLRWLFPFLNRHHHVWECVSTFHYLDISYDQKAKSTCATYVCTGCKEAKTKDFYAAGYLTVAQLNGKI